MTRGSFSPGGHSLQGVIHSSDTGFGCSGVARTSPLLGHSMGTLRLYELPREVQKLIGGLGASSPPQILQPPRSVLRPYTIAKCKSLKAKLAYHERIRFDRNSVL